MKKSLHEKIRLIKVVMLAALMSVGISAHAVEMRDTTVTVAEAGALSKTFPGEKWTTPEKVDSVANLYSGLKINGPLNGDDIIYLQGLCGSWGRSVSANISSLDLSGVSLKSGGSAYDTDYTGSDPVELYTEDNVIGAKMFSYCGSLTKLVLPDNTERVNSGAFSYSPQLAEIIISSTNPYYVAQEGVLYDKKIAELLFYSPAKDNTSFFVPSTVEKISDSAFMSTRNLHSVTLPDGLKAIGGNAFSGSGIESISVPAKVESIGKSAFSYCQNLKTAEMPSEVCLFGDGMFMGDANLTKATVPMGAVDVTQSFYGCSSLTRITLPSTVTIIGDGAFSSCSSLSKIKIPSAKTIGSSAFDGCSSLEILIIPEGVESIGQRAFANCSKLGKLILPSTLKSVGNYILSLSNYNVEVALYAEEVPGAEEYSFYPALYASKLFVPDPSVMSYKDDSIWANGFGDVLPVSEFESPAPAEFNILTEEFIPDGEFRAWIKENIASGADAYTNLQAADYDGEIYIGYTGIASLQGIEYFTSLRRIALTNNNELTSVDLTSNKALKEIDVLYSMKLQQLKLDGLENIEVLNVGMTSLNGFDISKFEYLAPKLRELNLSKLHLDAIDLSPFVNLESLDISANKFTSIDCSGLSKMRLLSVSATTPLQTLNLSGCSALEELIASSCSLVSLDLSDNQNIKEIYVQDNPELGDFDFSSLKPNLVFLNVGNTGRKELDLSGCVNLEDLECPGNPLTSTLDLSVSKRFNWLRVESTGITGIDVSSCPMLEEFYCYDNNLERLDISGNTNLIRLVCFKNPMTEIKVWKEFDIDTPPIDYLKDESARFVYEFGQGGMTIVNGDNARTETARYDSFGRKLNAPVPGVNIVVYSDGSVEKMIEVAR